jgi:hypothetical protein
MASATERPIPLVPAVRKKPRSRNGRATAEEGLGLALCHAPWADPPAGRGKIVVAEIRGHERERGIAVIHLVLPQAERADQPAGQERALQHAARGLHNLVQIVDAAALAG